MPSFYWHGQAWLVVVYRSPASYGEYRQLLTSMAGKFPQPEGRFAVLYSLERSDPRLLPLEPAVLHKVTAVCHRQRYIPFFGWYGARSNFQLQPTCVCLDKTTSPILDNWLGNVFNDKPLGELHPLKGGQGDIYAWRYWQKAKSKSIIRKLNTLLLFYCITQTYAHVWRLIHRILKCSSTRIHLDKSLTAGTSCATGRTTRTGSAGYLILGCRTPRTSTKRWTPSWTPTCGWWWRAPSRPPTGTPTCKLSGPSPCPSSSTKRTASLSCWAVFSASSVRFAISTEPPVAGTLRPQPPSSLFVSWLYAATNVFIFKNSTDFNCASLGQNFLNEMSEIKFLAPFFYSKGDQSIAPRAGGGPRARFCGPRKVFQM